MQKQFLMHTYTIQKFNNHSKLSRIKFQSTYLGELWHFKRRKTTSGDEKMMFLLKTFSQLKVCNA